MLHIRVDLWARKRKIKEKEKNFVNDHVKDEQLVNLNQLKDDYHDIDLVKLIKDMGILIIPLCECINPLKIYGEVTKPLQKQELLDTYTEEVIMAFINHMEDNYTTLSDPLIPIILPYMNDA